MGMNQISVVSPRSEQTQKKEKKSDIEKIIEGLQVAQGILGIGVNVQQIRANQSAIETQEQNRGLAAVEAMDKATDRSNAIAGTFNKPQQVEIAKDFRQAQPGEKADFTGTDSATNTPLGWVRRENQPHVLKTRAVTTVKDGKKVTQIVPDEPGAVYDAPPDKPPAIDPNDRKQEKLQASRERAQRQLNLRIDDFDDQASAADEVLGIAKSGRVNPLAANALGVKLARATGEKGVLTDADAARYGGSNDLQGRLQRYLQRAAEGTITPEDAAFATEFATTLREAANRKKFAESERMVKQFTKNYGGDFAENYEIITGNPYEPPTKEKPAPAGAPQAPAGSVAGIGQPSGGTGTAIAAPKAPPPPKVGEVVDGFVFQGGNPADPNSWKPVAPTGAK